LHNDPNTWKMFTVLMNEIKDRKNYQRVICQYIPKDTSMENIVKDYLFLFWSVFRAKSPVDVTDERTALARSMVVFFKDLAKEFESDPQVLDVLKRAVKVRIENWENTYFILYYISLFISIFYFFIYLFT